MTRRWAVWAAKRQWLAPLDHDYTVPLERRVPPYAECQGPADPCCGRCRFSVHGCNSNGPSRRQFLDDD